MSRAGEPCEIEERICTECGECDVCEQNPSKICDNCCECLNEPDTDFLAIEIEDILLGSEEIAKSYRAVNKYQYKRQEKSR